MNAGFLEAGKMFAFNCVFFHGVDLIPENDKIIYECGEQPRHLSVAIDEDNYKFDVQLVSGWSVRLRPETFRKVNGYSNMFWGWGAEDDDMYLRVQVLNTWRSRMKVDGVGNVSYNYICSDLHVLN